MSVLILTITFFGLLYCFQGSWALDRLTVFTFPPRIHSFDNNNVQIICHASLPITQCEFKITDNAIFDLNKGIHTPPNDMYKYHGGGLNQGDCGISFNVALLTYYGYVVGCRVRTNNSHWEYAEMTLDNSKKQDVELKDEPIRQITISPEDEKTDILIKTTQPLTKCEFIFADDEGKLFLQSKIIFNNSNMGDFNGQKIAQFGAGLQDRECGFVLTREMLVTHDVRGIWVVLSTATGRGSYFTRIILERPQEVPVMHVESTRVIDGGVLTASCRVNGSRPRASIGWTFGGEKVEGGIIVPEEKWSWPSSLHTTVEKFTRKVTKSDNGKKLQCFSEGLIWKDSQAMTISIEPQKTNSSNKLMTVVNIAVFTAIAALVATIR